MKKKTFDENLIKKTAAGDAEAFKKVYEGTGSAVYGLALSILRNRHDAEDAMHETFLKVYKNAGMYRPEGKPLAWVLTITRNVCFNMLQSRTVHEDIEKHTYLEDVSANTEEIAENKMILNSALSLLEADEREIIMLHALAGWKHREIAEFTGLPLSTVLSKYNRSLKKMRQAIQN